MQKNIHTDISAYMNMEEGRNPKRHRNNVAEDTGGLTAIIPARSRWRPTGDQRQILERLYEQGIRKPSADQIQQITARLKTLGPIEPKNVFYWFHNFKAKLRLKLKQVQVHEQSSTMLNIPSHDVTTLVRNPCFQERDSNAKRCIYTSSVTSTSARSSVSLEKELASNIPRNETDGKRLSADHGSRYKYGCRPVDSSDEVNDENTAMISNNSSENSKTLVLFPLTPTSGILRGRDYREAEKCVLE